MIKYGDIILNVLIISIAIFLFINNKQETSETIIINAVNKELRYTINQNEIIEVDGIIGKSLIKVENKTAYIIDSACRDKICVKAGKLINAPIICIPNGVLLRFDKIVDNEGEEIDSIVQ